MTADTNPKDRLGLKKVPLSLVPMVVLVYLALAFAEGARKYGEFNWRRKSVRRRVYLEAILRHCLAALAGEDIDADSGLPHEAKIAACCAIILDAKECGNLIDDRFEKDATATLLARHTAGDYHAAAEATTRTPARTLDEINRTWAEAALADQADAGRQVDQARDRALPVAGQVERCCPHTRRGPHCFICEPDPVVARAEARELPITAYGPG